MKITASQIQPLADRLLIEPDPVDSEQSGIIIPDNAKERPQTGTVIASGLGANVTLIGDSEAKQDVINLIGDKAFGLLSKIFERLAVVKNELKAGDRIVFGAYAGQELTIDDKTYLIVRESDVIGRLKE